MHRQQSAALRAVRSPCWVIWSLRRVSTGGKEKHFGGVAEHTWARYRAG